MGTFHIARYILVDNEAIIKRLGSESVNGFVYNLNALKEAPNAFCKEKSANLQDIMQHLQETALV